MQYVYGTNNSDRQQRRLMVDGRCSRSSYSWSHSKKITCGIYIFWLQVNTVRMVVVQYENCTKLQKKCPKRRYWVGVQIHHFVDDPCVYGYIKKENVHYIMNTFMKLSPKYID